MRQTNSFGTLIFIIIFCVGGVLAFAFNSVGDLAGMTALTMGLDQDRTKVPPISARVPEDGANGHQDLALKI